MAILTDYWPYWMLLLVGFLPNDGCRMAGLVIGRSLKETSEVFIWLRAVATGVLAALVAQLILMPPQALAGVPIEVRVAAIALGFGAYAVTRAPLAGTLVGVAALLGGRSLLLA